MRENLFDFFILVLRFTKIFLFKRRFNDCVYNKVSWVLENLIYLFLYYNKREIKFVLKDETEW